MRNKTFVVPHCRLQFDDDNLKDQTTLGFVTKIAYDLSDHVINCTNEAELKQGATPKHWWQPKTLLEHILLQRHGHKWLYESNKLWEVQIDRYKFDNAIYIDESSMFVDCTEEYCCLKFNGNILMWHPIENMYGCYKTLINIIRQTLLPRQSQNTSLVYLVC